MVVAAVIRYDWKRYGVRLRVRVPGIRTCAHPPKESEQTERGTVPVARGNRCDPSSFPAQCPSFPIFFLVLIIPFRNTLLLASQRHPLVLPLVLTSSVLVYLVYLSRFPSTLNFDPFPSTASSLLFFLCPFPTTPNRSSRVCSTCTRLSLFAFLLVLLFGFS